MKIVFRTDDAWSSVILRVMLGVLMFPYGAQKLFGWFGGLGFTGPMALFTERLQIPAALAFLVIMAESLGSVGLIIGLPARLSAFGVACVMVGAVWKVHRQYGFFMNWHGKQAGEGFEYHLLVLAICLAMMIAGAGRWSVDRAVASRSGGLMIAD